MSHLRLKCTKFDFGWGSGTDAGGELTALPDPVPGFGDLTSVQMDGKGPGEEGRKAEGRQQSCITEERKGKQSGEGKGGQSYSTLPSPPVSASPHISKLIPHF